MSTSSRPKRSAACLTTSSTAAKSLTSAATVATPPALPARSSRACRSASALTSLSTRSVSGSAASCRDRAVPSVPPAPRMAMTRRVLPITGFPSGAAWALAFPRRLVSQRGTEAGFERFPAFGVVDVVPAAAHLHQQVDELAALGAGKAEVAEELRVQQVDRLTGERPAGRRHLGDGD